MTTLDELREMRERLEKAEGPDRELDADICATLRHRDDKNPDNKWLWTNFPIWRNAKHGHVEVVHDDGSGGAVWYAEHLTSSLDAAIALVEAKMPGARRQMQMDYGGNFCYWLTPPDCMMSSAIHASEPIALLLALLSALEKESAE